MVFYMTVTRLPIISSMMNNGTVIEINLENIAKGILLNEFYFPFWYLQDLIVLMILAPLFVLIVRNKVLLAITFVVMVVCNVMSIDLIIINSSSALFFLLGGTVAIYGREYWEQRSKYACFYLMFFIIICVIRLIGIPVISNLCYYLSPIVLWKLFDLFMTERVLTEKIKWFVKQSFFIYAAHIIPITVIGHLLSKIGQGFWWMLISYLVAPWITLFLLYIVANILHKYIPVFYKVICGDRV